MDRCIGGLVGFVGWLVGWCRVLEIIFEKCLVNVSINGLERRLLAASIRRPALTWFTLTSRALAQFHSSQLTLHVRRRLGLGLFFIF